MGPWSGLTNHSDNELLNHVDLKIDTIAGKCILKHFKSFELDAGSP